MHTLSHATAINPPGVSPELTAEQVWRGLVMKAENALPFVPGMSRCDVVKRSGNTLLRDITVRGGDFRELITFHAPVQVHFQRVGSGGFIENTISQSDLGLILAFTFSVPFPGVEEGSAAEREMAEAMRDSYVEAIGATLDRVRQLVRDGAL